MRALYIATFVACSACASQNPMGLQPEEVEAVEELQEKPLAAPAIPEGCDQALSHVVALSMTATGSGPTDADRGEFMRRCAAITSGAPIDCVLKLKSLPRQKSANLDPVWRCF